MTRNPFSSLRGAGDHPSRPRGGRSYVRGDNTEALRHITVPELLRETVHAHGSREAAVFCADGVRWSWHDLQRGADDVAAGLLALGIGRGDRVALWAPNCPQWLLVQFGAARIGAILVNVNPAYRTAELEYVLRQSGSRVLIMARAHKSSNYVAMLQSLAPELGAAGEGRRVHLDRLPDLEQVVLIGPGDCPSGMQPFARLTALAGPAQRARLDDLSAQLDPDDAINIQYTSGTTGSPKGATLTHYNIVNNARHTAAGMDFTARDRLCIPVPLYHCFGMVMGVLACAASGAAMVFPGPAFDAEQTLRAVARERCTALHGVPTMFIAALEHPQFGQHDLTSLRTGIMAGAPCPVETMRRVIGEMHMADVTIAYGMTETSPVSTQTSARDSLERRVGSVGRVHPHTEIKIVDARGRVVPVGQSGELCVRGYLVMHGYWNDVERTGEMIDGAGWLRTGDLATVDADGYFNIVGRVKDMLIRGGENVYPREVEEFLFRHPKVQAAQVFGVPDARLGEEVCAWIVLKPGQSAREEELRSYCRAQIAHYKVPRYIRFVAEFPSTVTGKPQKYLMREAMVRELNATVVRTA